MEYPKTAKKLKNLYSDRLNRLPEPFAFSQLIYEGQRQAFMQEMASFQVKLKTSRIHRTNNPSPSSPLSSTPLPPTMRSRSSELKKDNQVYKRRLRYCNKINSLMNKCDDHQKLPDVNSIVNRERKLIKKYSQRMDWTINTLQKHKDLDYKIVAPLFDYYTRENFENQLTARKIAFDLRRRNASSLV